jgi:hypothetical protein
MENELNRLDILHMAWYAAARWLRVISVEG